MAPRDIERRSAQAFRLRREIKKHLKQLREFLWEQHDRVLAEIAPEVRDLLEGLSRPHRRLPDGRLKSKINIERKNISELANQVDALIKQNKDELASVGIR